jgi:phosphoribosylformylglycinamidine synthase subunit PurQ / glutaminase
MASRLPIAIIPTGFGINCEAETAHALRLAGAEVDLVHLNDLAADTARLARARILALAGGFSFGDHLGSGRVLANRWRRRLGSELSRFVDDGGLVIGLCNGFQTMARLGLVPGGTVGGQIVALAPNYPRAGYVDRWVTLVVDPASPCVFLRGLTTLEVPVRHGEGRVVCSSAVLEEIRAGHLAPVRYADPATGQPTDAPPHNPNGSIDAIAGLCDRSGRVFGLMPHPEAFLYAENHPRWRRRPSAEHGEGLQIFRNAVEAAR